MSDKKHSLAGFTVRPNPVTASEHYAEAIRLRNEAVTMVKRESDGEIFIDKYSEAFVALAHLHATLAVAYQQLDGATLMYPLDSGQL